MSEIKIFTVDAFTKNVFSGNSAAVCLIEEEISDELCHKIASEMNIAETAFIRKLTPSDNFKKSRSFGLRWFTFTGTNEVPLCGHATLASAHVLFNIIKNRNSEINFETRFVGTLTCQKKDNGRIEMDFPLWDCEDYLDQMTPEISAVSKEFTNGYPVREFLFCEAEGYKKLIVVFHDTVTKKELESIEPDMGEVAKLGSDSEKIGMVDLTLKGSWENGCVDSDGRVYDFVSRIFDLPVFGGMEDPVTGSAHSALASYWWKRTGKTEFYARQASKRGGDLYLRIDEASHRLKIQGNTVTVLEGKLYI